MYDYLLQLDTETLEFQPSLAEEWEISDDGMQFTFKIRQGVPWHEEEGFVTAEDVKFTFDQTVRDDSATFNAAYYRDVIESVDAPDDETVVITLTRPDPTFLGTLTSNGTQWIVPKAYIERVGEPEYEAHPIGSGPYRLAEIAQGGAELVYEAVTEHWRVVPAFESLVYRIVPEESTRLAMLQNGEVDLTPISHDSLIQVEGQEGLGLKTMESAYSTGFMFGGMLHPDDPRRTEASGQDPWADPLVREAMSIAINRQELVDTIYQGYADPLNILLFTPGYDELPPVEYDPDRARELLAEAGYPDGFDFEVPTHPRTPGTELPVLSEAVAGYWQDIGLRPEVIPTDPAIVAAGWNEGHADGWVIPFRHPNVTEWETWLVYFEPGDNLPSSDDVRFTELLAQLAAATDPEERAALYQEFTQFQNDEYTTIGVAVVDNVFGLNTDVIGDWPVPAGAYEIYQEYITRPGESLPFVLDAP